MAPVIRICNELDEQGEWREASLLQMQQRAEPGDALGSAW